MELPHLVCWGDGPGLPRYLPAFIHYRSHHTYFAISVQDSYVDSERPDTHIQVEADTLLARRSQETTWMVGMEIQCSQT